MPREPTAALPVDSMDGKALKPLSPGFPSGRAPLFEPPRGFSFSRLFVVTAGRRDSPTRNPFSRSRRVT
jgi:hypothetical protein